MTERSRLWRRAGEAAEAGTAAALASVARQRGSVPMASDAKMLVTGTGARFGTVGGGCLEADVTGQAIETIAAGRPQLVRHTLNAERAGDLGLSCGGTVELFVEPLLAGAEGAAIYHAVADAIEGRTAAVVATALAWDAGPRKATWVGEQRYAVGAFDAAPPAVRRLGIDAARELFLEPVPRRPRLILFGAGHVGQEIARVAAGTDFHVVVVDDRADFASRDRFPDADELMVSDLREVLDGLELDADDFVISATRGHAMDAVVVERAAASPARYVGMLGSRRKQAVIWKALEQAGVPRPALERVKVPIGEDIGADTPAEIAIAGLAELVRIRRSVQPAE
jgi:xanthine dehydrogenase accessory factor